MHCNAAIAQHRELSSAVQPTFSLSRQTFSDATSASHNMREFSLDFVR